MRRRWRRREGCSGSFWKDLGGCDGAGGRTKKAKFSTMNGKLSNGKAPMLSSGGKGIVRCLSQKKLTRPEGGTPFGWATGEKERARNPSSNGIGRAFPRQRPHNVQEAYELKTTVPRRL